MEDTGKIIIYLNQDTTVLSYGYIFMKIASIAQKLTKISTKTHPKYDVEAKNDIFEAAADFSPVPSPPVIGHCF